MGLFNIFGSKKVENTEPTVNEPEVNIQYKLVVCKV